MGSSHNIGNQAGNPTTHSGVGAISMSFSNQVAAPAHDRNTPLEFFRTLLAKGHIVEAVKELSSRGGDVAMACFIDGDTYNFAHGCDASYTTCRPNEIGCIIRNLVALLIAQAEAEGMLRSRDPVASYFPSVSGIDPALCVFHLLNQSHGIDVKSTRAPYTDTGHIDADIIWREARELGAMAPPGAVFYHYACGGLWLAAAILERVHGQPFTDILKSKLLTPIAVHALVTKGTSVCPAYGGMEISCSDLLKICRLHLRGSGNQLLSDILEKAREEFRVDVPAWPLVADSACPGWLTYGSAHAAFGNRRGVTSLMMLISPSEDAAIVIASRQFAGIHTAQREFFPAIFGQGRQSPRPLSKEERNQFPLDSYVGRYQQGGYVLVVFRDPDGELKGSVYPLNTGSEQNHPVVTRMLLPAVDNTLYPVPPEPKIISYLRFLKIDKGAEFSHVTTGKHLFRRV